MTISDMKLKASLAKKISEWVDENCEEKEWPSFYIHDEGDALMTDAAYSVFMAMYQSQAFAKENE